MSRPLEPDPGNAGAGKWAHASFFPFHSSSIYPHWGNFFMLRVSNLSEHFGELSIFENFDLRLPCKGFIVLIGEK
jgi:hypothetical protein